MGKKRVLVSYGVDIDAVAGWLGSYGGEDSTSDISRGELCYLYAGVKCIDIGRTVGWNGRDAAITQALR